MDALVTELVEFIVLELKRTPLNKDVDITHAKAKITELVADIVLKLDKINKGQILSFVKGTEIFQQCILPNLTNILADNKLNLDDTPFFLDMIYGIYARINEFIQTNPTITVSSNDLIEMSGLLLKVTLALLVTNPVELNLGISLINSTIKLVKLNIKNKIKSCKLLCCSFRCGRGTY